jgi:hypothetical protein
MLPKPRPSSRITSSGSRRIASPSETTVTSRIARRVPSPLQLVATSYNNNGTNLITPQARSAVPHTHPATTDCNLLSLPTSEFGPRHTGAGPPSSRRIPAWSAGLTSSSYPTPEQSEASFTGTPSPEAKNMLVDVNVQYRTPPPTTSMEVKHERFFRGQEGHGRTIIIPAQQHQDTAENWDPAASAAASLLARQAHAHPPRRRPASASTALTLTLTSNGFSRVLDNNSPRDGGGGDDSIIPATLTWKKPAFTHGSVSGKENRRPTRMHVRVPPPPVVPAPAPTIPPRSVRRTVVVAQPPSRTSSSFRETSRPLVIRKQLPAHSLTAASGFSHVRSASGTSSTIPVVSSVPVGIQVLIGDIDRFAKEWTTMFDELSEDREDGLSKLDAFIRIRSSTSRPEDVGSLQRDGPAAGKGSASTNGETVQFDVTPASLARWQHKDKAMVRDAPEEDKPVRKYNHSFPTIAHIQSLR